MRHNEALFTFLRMLLVSPGAGAVYRLTKFSRAYVKTPSHIPSKLTIILTVS